MGKKRIAQKGTPGEGEGQAKAQARIAKKKVVAGTFFVQSTYNNTKALVSDKEGNALFWTSSGTLGFRGAKKGTPFASAKVGETLGEKASAVGIKEVNVVVRGVGAGRESAIRAFASKGIEISGIQDRTPVPHNGPKAKKPRRV